MAKPWQTSSSEHAVKAHLGIFLSLASVFQKFNLQWCLLSSVSRNEKCWPGKFRSTNKALLCWFTADTWLPASPHYRVMQMHLLFFISSQNTIAAVKQQL